MNQVEGVEADHHVFIIPGVVDASVVHAQALRKLDQRGETTYVHDHRADEKCQGHEHRWYGPELNTGSV